MEGKMTYCKGYELNDREYCHQCNVCTMCPYYKDGECNGCDVNMKEEEKEDDRTKRDME